MTIAPTLGVLSTPLKEVASPTGPASQDFFKYLAQQQSQATAAPAHAVAPHGAQVMPLSYAGKNPVAAIGDRILQGVEGFQRDARRASDLTASSFDPAAKATQGIAPALPRGPAAAPVSVAVPAPGAAAQLAPANNDSFSALLRSVMEVGNFTIETSLLSKATSQVPHSVDTLIKGS